jgi:hypothetical protein
MLNLFNSANLQILIIFMTFNITIFYATGEGDTIYSG